MALTLSLKAGEDFYVGMRRFEVIGPVRRESFKLRNEAGDTFDICDDEALEILPRVLVSVGASCHYGQARVVIQAPREIVVLRGAKWREAMQPA